MSLHKKLLLVSFKAPDRSGFTGRLFHGPSFHERDLLVGNTKIDWEILKIRLFRFLFWKSLLIPYCSPLALFSIELNWQITNMNLKFIDSVKVHVFDLSSICKTSLILISLLETAPLLICGFPSIPLFHIINIRWTQFKECNTLESHILMPNNSVYT